MRWHARHPPASHERGLTDVTDGDRRGGSILVVVLLLVGVIAALAAAAAEMKRGSYAAGIAYADGLRAESAMRSAIERTVAHAGERTTQLRGGIISLENATVTLEIRDESGRIDLNFAPKELLAGLLRVVGIDAPDATELAGRIVAWRERTTKEPGDDGQVARPDAGRVAFDGAAFPPNPFYHPVQLAQIDGIDRRVARALQPYLTVASGRPTVDPLLADMTVLLAVPGMTPDRAAAFLRERGEQPAAAERLAREIRNGANYLSRSSGAASRFLGRVNVSDRTQRTFEAVVAVVSGDDAPYRILSWDSVPTPAVR